MDHIDERIQHQKELAERRRIWEEQRQTEADQREKQEKRDRLESYLRRRGEEWTDTTGSLPSTWTIERWQEEYMAKIAAEEERERQLRLAQAEDNAVI